jgi:DNA topoisomerase-6 subunit B
MEVASDEKTPPAPSQATRFRVTVIDYGPGIVRQQIPKIFAKLLYGSKFHRLRMSRGQQGIGISAAGMYAQLTTGKPVQIISRTSAKSPAHYFEVQIDTKKNEPRIFENKQIEWESHRGTQVTLEIDGRYQKGRASVDEYLEQVAIANPHVKLVYHTPDGETKEYPRTIQELPPQPREIKPHPYGIEFGIMLRMLHDTKSHTVAGFLSSDFSRGFPRRSRSKSARRRSSRPDAKPRNVHGAPAEALYKAIRRPRSWRRRRTASRRSARRRSFTACITDQRVNSTRRSRAAVGLPRQPVRRSKRRSPSATRRGQAAGQGASEGAARRGRRATTRMRSSRASSVTPTASRCSISRQAARRSRRCWRRAGATTALRNHAARCRPGPMAIFVHMASVWVPFTERVEEAIADYDEIRKEIKLALQECGRRLGVFLRRREHAKSEFRRRNIFELYIEEVVDACNRLKGREAAEGKTKAAAARRSPLKRTGGEKVDELLGKKKSPEGPARFDHCHARGRRRRRAGAAPATSGTEARPCPGTAGGAGYADRRRAVEGAEGAQG